MECPFLHEVAADGLSCVCQLGTYNATAKKAVCVESVFDDGRTAASVAAASQCEECPRCILCDQRYEHGVSGEEIRVQVGYAALVTDASNELPFVNVFRCGNVEACPGNVTLGASRDPTSNRSGCAEGYSGVLCSSCVDDFYTTLSSEGVECTPCGKHGNVQRSVAWGAVILCACVAGLVLTHWMGNRDAADNISKYGEVTNNRFEGVLADVKTLLGLAQVLSLCGVTFQIQFPSPFFNLTAIFGFLNLDILDLLNVQCTIPYDFNGKFAARCCVPLLILGLIRVVGTVFAHRNTRSEMLRAAFEAADEDGNGTLDAEEMRVVCATLQLDMSADEIRAELKCAGDADFETFRNWWQ